MAQHSNNDIIKVYTKGIVTLFRLESRDTILWLYLVKLSYFTQHLKGNKAERCVIIQVLKGNQAHRFNGFKKQIPGMPGMLLLLPVLQTKRQTIKWQQTNKG